MEDILSELRINCENLTDDEWSLLEKAERAEGWFIPSKKDWCSFRGVMKLIDLRHGFDVAGAGDVIQMGWPHLRINEHGIKALELHRKGEFYQIGDTTTIEDVWLEFMSISATHDKLQSRKKHRN